jgi:condensin-2 complex subunit D3
LFRKRQAIYKIMLQHMTEEQKFNTTAKLCQDVLGGVVDGLISLDSPTASDLIQVSRLFSLISRPARG